MTDPFHEVCEHCGRHIAVAGHSPDCKGELPEEWPETFTDPTLDCNCVFTWDTVEAAYICMYCNERREEPPEKYTETEDEVES